MIRGETLAYRDGQTVCEAFVAHTHSRDKRPCVATLYMPSLRESINDPSRGLVYHPRAAARAREAQFSFLAGTLSAPSDEQ